MALPVFDQHAACQAHQDEVSLVVAESSLRFTAGGDRGLLDGERGRFPARGVDIAPAQLYTHLRGKAVHRDDALTKQRVPKDSSF
jgi:hypothetical protein